uniref:Uncharacterized protein n=1 Tax=Hyaloperonospora arabidopsidis (strain Emoy2) TaxID=559515 RepID=M4BMP9_HYAAE
MWNDVTSGLQTRGRLPKAQNPARYRLYLLATCLSWCDLFLLLLVNKRRRWAFAKLMDGI